MRNCRVEARASETGLLLILSFSLCLKLVRPEETWLYKEVGGLLQRLKHLHSPRTVENVSWDLKCLGHCLAFLPHEP